MEELYHHIGQGAMMAGPAGWKAAKIVVRILYSQAEIEATYSFDDGTSTRAKVPIEILDAFEEIRNAMYQPGKGAWYTAICKIDRTRELTTSFDYDNRPEFSHRIPDEDFIEDLQEFPRDPELVPHWMPKSRS